MAENEFDTYDNGEKTGTQSENKTSSKKSTGKKSNAFMQILNGEFLTKEFFLNNLNYIFFIMALLLVIVSKGYYGKQLIDETNKTQRELDQKDVYLVKSNIVHQVYQSLRNHICYRSKINKVAPQILNSMEC